MTDKLTVDELHETDLEPLLDYWFQLSEDELLAMGVELSLMPTRDELRRMLESQLSKDYEDKQAYALIWKLNERAVGHSNINRIEFGKEAYMHLHLWDKSLRKTGYGQRFVQKCLPLYFENFKLDRLICEPFAENPGPHRLLEKIGFVFEKEYETVPGALNGLQMVKRWVFPKELC